jgi:MFS family permease
VGRAETRSVAAPDAARALGGVTGATLIASGCLTTATVQPSPPTVGAGLVLVGVGWSACVVAGSTLLTDTTAPNDRPAAQGVNDIGMGLAASPCCASATAAVAVSTHDSPLGEHRRCVVDAAYRRS